MEDVGNRAKISLLLRWEMQQEKKKENEMNRAGFLSVSLRMGPVIPGFFWFCFSVNEFL